MQYRYYETTIWNYALGRERWFQPLFYSLFAYVITLETSTWNPPLGLALAPASETTELVFPVSFWSVNPSSGWFPLLLSITFNTINTKRKSEWYKNFIPRACRAVLFVRDRSSDKLNSRIFLHPHVTLL